MKTVSVTQLRKNIGEAKNAAQTGPVVITRYGRPAYVLMSFAHYQKMCGPQRKIADLLAMPQAVEADV